MAKVKSPLISLDEFKNQFHIKVNEQQEKAMCKVDGPTLLLAVPGSGKTTVIVSRAGYMLHCAGIPAGNILNLTFSVDAANEMRHRFQAVFGSHNEPSFSTIHSFCLKVIRYCKDNWGIHVPQLEPHNERIIRRALSTLTDIFPSANIVREIQSAITLVKNRMMSDEEAKLETSDLVAASILGVDFMTIYKAYIDDKNEHDLMDFDDQLVIAYELLTEYPDALLCYQKQFTHISVDEAQDTSKIQHEIIRLLVSGSHNLFMVGDDDQSIYRFRGAVPAYLLDFGHIYAGAEILHMDINYRSDKSIIRQADQFIQENKERFPKRISCNTDSEGLVESINVLDMSDQYERLYRLLKDDAADPSRTTAVLYRNNDSVLPLLDIIMRSVKSGHQLQVRCHAEPETFFTSPIVDSLLAILRFAESGSSDDFMKIYYRLGLYINKKAASQIVQAATRDDIPIIEAIKDHLSTSSLIKYETVKQALFRMRIAPPEVAINIAIDKLNYEEQAKSESEFSKQKLDILKILARPRATAKEFIHMVEVWKGYDSNAFYSMTSNITLSTVHSSKGLEFDRVVIMDATDVILPVRSSYQDGCGTAFEEEARLFYVGATRAKHRLTFLNYDYIFGESSTKSRFIDRFTRDASVAKRVCKTEKAATATTFTSPIMKKLAEESSIKDPIITPGARVCHTTFGNGIVQDLAPGGIAIIIFDVVGKKKLMLDVCLENGMLRIS